MNKQEIQAKLNQVNAAIAQLEALRGTLSETQLAQSLKPLREEEAALTEQLAQAAADPSALSAPGGSTVLGDRAVNVGGSVGGSIITGDQNRVGGIRANRIEADHVVDGMQMLGGDISSAAGAAALAEALVRGGITADSIEAKNVVSGFQYIADPAQATPDELRQEIAHLREQLEQALAAAGAAPSADLTDAQEALDTAEAELAQPEPQGSRILRKLKEATEILTDSTRMVDAATTLGQSLIKLAPVAAALYQIATRLFGG